MGLKSLDLMFQMQPHWWNEELVITMHADNDEAIRRSEDDVEHCCTTTKTRGESDAEAKIRALSKKLQIVKVGHAKGHRQTEKMHRDET